MKIEAKAVDLIENIKTSFSNNDINNSFKLLELLEATLLDSQSKITFLENEINSKNKEIEYANANFIQLQNQLIDSEKMALLGQLVAGIAHELNTPIGAIKASSGIIQEIFPLIFKGFEEILNSNNEQKLIIFEIVNQILNTEKKPLSSREVRAIKKELTSKLESFEVIDAQDVAYVFVESGIHEFNENWLSILNSEYRISVLKIIQKTGHILTNVNNIQISSDKTNRIVYALKSYAHKELDSTNQISLVNLVQNVDIVLTIYHNQIKYGVELETHFDDNVFVMANPDELGQIWTNLIHNALQAMNHNGKMFVNVIKKEGMAIVEFIDNGPGVPKDIQPKIFDAFFTTKIQGEGTGLGLSICKEIIEKFGGKLELESSPGNTIFRTFIPLIK